MRNVQRSLNVVATTVVVVVVACAVAVAAAAAATIVVVPLTTLLTLAFPRGAHNFICACFACTSLSVSPRSTTHTHTRTPMFACLLLPSLLLLTLVDFAACVCRAYAGPAPKLMSGLGCGCAALFVFHLRSAPSRMQRFFCIVATTLPCLLYTKCCTIAASTASCHAAGGQATVHRAYVCFTYNRSTW